MDKIDFMHGMMDAFISIQFPFTHDEVKGFEAGEGATFIELHDGRLYILNFEQLDPGPNDLIDVL